MLLEVQCEVSTVSDDLGCHVICWCWSTVFSEVHSQRSHLPGNFIFVINNFLFSFFYKQHNIISKIKQNKTADTYSTSKSSIKREGEREGQQEHKSHSFK